jgi:predicted nucleic acid-binding protein
MRAAPVLDSFALLAFLRGEAGDDKVAALLERAGERDLPLHMTEVNYAEVKHIVIRKDEAASWAEVARNLPTLPLEFHPADRELADAAADLKSRLNLSLAHAFAAALAKRLKAELVTGDPELKAVEKEIRVRWLT